MDREAEYADLLRRKAQRILANSGDMEAMPVTPERPTGTEPGAPAAARSESAQFEAVIRWYRPVLAITDDKFVESSENPAGDPRFRDPNQAASNELLKKLRKHRAVIDRTLRSVGRIELRNNVQFPWVGTGWLIGSEDGGGIVVTNAHVAREFAQRTRAGFVFRPGVPDYTAHQIARIDFREELARSEPREFPITEVVWISEDPALDMAVLRAARTAGQDSLAEPIKLFGEALTERRMLAVAGYPGSNNGYDPEPFRRLFGPVLGVKRFSPGFYTGDRSGSVTYDCSTLPGSSGSVVLDIETGKAVGLHFAGTAFDTNYAVPAREIARTLRSRPWHPSQRSQPAEVLADGTNASATSSGAAPAASALANPCAAAQIHGNQIRFVVPLEFTIGVGALSCNPATPICDRDGDGSNPSNGRKLPVTSAVARVKEHLAGDNRVFTVKAERLFRNGQLSDQVGVLVYVAPDATLDPGSYGLGSSVDGVEIEIEPAPAPDVVAQLAGPLREAFRGRRAEYQRDLSDPRFNLDPVTDEMTILLHASPEAGWPVLREFLARTNVDLLTIGMYHMTAPHVVKAIESIARRRGTKIKLTLDRQRGDGDKPDDTSGPTKADDIPESTTLAKLESIAQTRFDWAPASLGANGLFASAYHIKVVVWSNRTGSKVDDIAFWLSSGNWQSSNQAPLEQTAEEIQEITWDDVGAYNREWHAVVEHPGLAATFRHHLEQDYEDNASAAADERPVAAELDVLVPVLEKPKRPRRFTAFDPLTLTGRIKVQPLLTPDNYPEVVTQLIRGARSRILFENQSFSFWSDVDSTPEHFLKLAAALKERQEDGVEVRIIFRSGYGKERDIIRALAKFGLKTGRDDVRYFDTCHTKGLVIDDDIVVLGSHNWTAGGTGPNRDASLVIWNREANRYFAQLFQYDWDFVAQHDVRSRRGREEAVRFVPSGSEAPLPPGYERVSLAEFLGET